MTYPLYIILGLAPSVIWLLFFLRKDVHPESNRMILKIFLGGMLAAVLAVLIELWADGILRIFVGRWLKIIPISIFFFFLYHLLIVGLVEEFSKYLIVKEKVINDPEFDEPVDVMLYMIIVALGFAALENVLVLFSGKGNFLFGETVFIIIVRFIGATFLHALCSGTLGYFLALSFFETKKRLKLIIKGIAIATILHAFFNISIIGVEAGLRIQNYPLSLFAFVFVITILIGLAFFVLFGFRKLKKIASVCKLT